MPQFQIFAQKRINSRSAELDKRIVDGTEDEADEAIEELEEDGWAIADVHVFHSSIARQQATATTRQHRGRH